MTYLITGATGDVGSRVVERLLQCGDRPRVFVREEKKARSRFGDRVEVFVGDLSDPTSLRAALEGVQALFLVNTGPQIPVQDEGAAKVAKARGVKHLVKLSSMDVEQGLATGGCMSGVKQLFVPAEYHSRSCNPRDSCRICWPGRL